MPLCKPNFDAFSSITRWNTLPANNYTVCQFSNLKQDRISQILTRATSSCERQCQDVWFFRLWKRRMRGKTGTGCFSLLLWHLGHGGSLFPVFTHFCPTGRYLEPQLAQGRVAVPEGGSCPFCPQVSFRYHCRLYHEWRRNNQRVMLLIPKSANVPSTQQSLLGLQPLKRSSKETIV